MTNPAPQPELDELVAWTFRHPLPTEEELKDKISNFVLEEIISLLPEKHEHNAVCKYHSKEWTDQHNQSVESWNDCIDEITQAAIAKYQPIKEGWVRQPNGLLMKPPEAKYQGEKNE